VVVCGALAFDDQAQEVLIHPTVLIAVRSPSTEACDRGEKFRRSRTWLPTCTDSVLVAQDQPVIEHYPRGDDGLWTLRTLEGLEAQLHLNTIGCTVTLAEVYARVVFPASPAAAA
jgi:Uma2 family endonuclease